MTLTVSRQGDRLWLEWSSGAKTLLVPLSSESFLDRLFWARISFTRNEQGEVTQLVWRFDQDYVAERIK